MNKYKDGQLAKLNLDDGIYIVEVYKNNSENGYVRTFKYLCTVVHVMKCPIRSEAVGVNVRKGNKYYCYDREISELTPMEAILYG